MEKTDARQKTDTKQGTDVRQKTDVKQETDVKQKLVKAGEQLLWVGFTCILVGVVMDFMLLVGFAFVCTGTAFILYTVGGVSHIKPLTVCGGVFLMLIGLLIMFAPVLAAYVRLPFYFREYVFYFGVGIICFGMSVINMSKKLACSVEVRARYEGMARQRGMWMTKYKPRFCFTYDGKEYCNTGKDVYSYSKINGMYEIGGEYPIRISPETPNLFRTKKGVGAGSVALIALGIFFVLLSVVGFVIA